jgi:hypothetical protein
VHPRPPRGSPATALVVAIVGAVTIMVGPVTPWPLGVAACGAVAVVCGAAILVLLLLRR